MRLIALEILQYSYWEHFKAAKDLALVLPVEHTKRVDLQKSMDEILVEIEKVKEWIA